MLGHKITDLPRAGVQVVLTIHSPAFLDILNLKGIALLRKRDGATRVTQLTRKQLAERCQMLGATRATAESILPCYAAATTNELLSGSFSRKIVLVEAPTEAMAVPIYLEKVHLSTVREGIAVIPVHGVGNLAKWCRLFSAYGIPTYPISDHDRCDDRSTKRSELLHSLGFDDDDTERYLTTEEREITESFTGFGGDFEKALRKVFGDDYVNLEEHAWTEFS